MHGEPKAPNDGKRLRYMNRRGVFKIYHEIAKCGGGGGGRVSDI